MMMGETVFYSKFGLQCCYVDVEYYHDVIVEDFHTLGSSTWMYRCKWQIQIL